MGGSWFGGKQLYLPHAGSQEKTLNGTPQRILYLSSVNPRRANPASVDGL